MNEGVDTPAMTVVPMMTKAGMRWLRRRHALIVKVRRDEMLRHMQ